MRRPVHHKGTMASAKSCRKRARFREFADGIPFFASLPEDLLDHLERVVVQRRYSKNEVILLEKDTLNYMYVLYSGRVKVVSTGVEGDEHILAIHKRGDFFGEMALLDGKTAPAAVIALQDAEVGLISRQDFEKCLLTDVRVLRGIVSVLCMRLREAWLKLKVLSLGKAEQRIRAVLYLIGQQFGVRDARGVLLTLELTHHEIANYASLSRETVTRQLQKLITAEEIQVLEDRKILLKTRFFQNLPL